MVLFSYRQNQSVRLRPDRPPQSCHLLDKTAQIGTSRLCRKSGKFLRKKTLLSSSVRLSPIHWRTARRSDEVMYPVHCLSKTYNNILRKCEQYHGQSLLLHDNYGKPGGREAELTRKASRSSFSSSSGFDASRAPMLDIMSTNSSKENIPSPKSRLLVWYTSGELNLHPDSATYGWTVSVTNYRIYHLSRCHGAFAAVHLPTGTARDSASRYPVPVLWSNHLRLYRICGKLLSVLRNEIMVMLTI